MNMNTNMNLNNMRINETLILEMEANVRQRVNGLLQVLTVTISTNTLHFISQSVQ